MTAPDPAQHLAHDLPLADRIIRRAIGEWVSTATATALAGTGNLNDFERGMREGINQMRHLHLSGWEYSVVPHILDELRRAGQLPTTTEESA